jgi:hypothetical protein
LRKLLLLLFLFLLLLLLFLLLIHLHHLLLHLFLLFLLLLRSCQRGQQTRIETMRDITTRRRGSILPFTFPPPPPPRASMEEL